MALRLKSSCLDVVSWLAFIYALYPNYKFSANIRFKSGAWERATFTVLACSNLSAPTVCSPIFSNFPNLPPSPTTPPHQSTLSRSSTVPQSLISLPWHVLPVKNTHLSPTSLWSLLLFIFQVSTCIFLLREASYEFLHFVRSTCEGLSNFSLIYF